MHEAVFTVNYMLYKIIMFLNNWFIILIKFLLFEILFLTICIYSFVNVESSFKGYNAHQKLWKLHWNLLNTKVALVNLIKILNTKYKNKNSFLTEKSRYALEFLNVPFRLQLQLSAWKYNTKKNVASNVCIHST